MFPIAGTALMTVGLGLLATLGTGSSTWAASGYMLVLGLGLGMVMQVLVLAVQNSVDYRALGVATSGTTLFRSTGGSIGVSLFGAIFAAGLASALAGAMPPGASLPAATDPAAIAALPAGLRAVYLDAFTAALHPVYVAATALAALAFALSWLLEEIPLQGPARSETIGESFAVPHDATSLGELETILERMTMREQRWESYHHIAGRIGVALAPDEIWLMVRLCLADAPVPIDAMLRQAAIPRPQFDALLARLVQQGLVERQPHDTLQPTPHGRELFERIVRGYRERLALYLERWAPGEREEVRSMLNAMARELVAELPVVPAGTTA
jgi:DNA-binding MarR family transcriptional regulator